MQERIRMVASVQAVIYLWSVWIGKESNLRLRGKVEGRLCFFQKYFDFGGEASFAFRFF